MTIQELFYEEIYPQFYKIMFDLVIENLEKLEEQYSDGEILHACICAISENLSDFIFTQEVKGAPLEYRNNICKSISKSKRDAKNFIKEIFTKKTDDEFANL